MELDVLSEALKSIEEKTKYHPEVTNGMLNALAFKHLEDLIGNQYEGYNTIKISFDDTTNTYHVRSNKTDLNLAWDAKSLRQALIGI